MTARQVPDEQDVYRITVEGVLDERWSDWFDKFTIIVQPDNETTLIGPVVDQAALYGLLAKIRDMALPLVSVERVQE